MTISRIDDADNLHLTYERKVTSVIWVRIILSIAVSFVCLIAWGILLMNSDSGENYAPIIIGVLIVAWLIFSGYLKMSRNNNFFTAYVFDENSMYRVNLIEAFGNDTLFGKNYSVSSRDGLIQRMKVTANMRKIRATSHLDEFICRQEVIDYSGYEVEKVFDISETKNFLRVKLQLRGSRLFNSYSRKKTVYIPNSFTNFDALHYELEKLI